MSERLFKCLEKGRISPHARFQWPYKKWVKAKGELVECKNGIHLCREQDLIRWLNDQIWEVEARGERVECGGKIIVREARLVKKLHTWNERTARLFICDCAEHVLPIYEKRYPGDGCLRKTTEVGRRYALGNASKKELETTKAVAWASAGAIAEATAEAATWTSAGAVEKRASNKAERNWQTRRLLSYLYPKGE